MTRLSSRSRPAARPIWTFPKGTRHTGLFWDTLQVIDVKFEVVDDFVIFDINEQIPEINLKQNCLPKSIYKFPAPH